MVDHMKHTIPDWNQAVVVAKNPGASKRAAMVAKQLKVHLAMIFWRAEQTGDFPFRFLVSCSLTRCASPLTRGQSEFYCYVGRSPWFLRFVRVILI